jgi:hypothetical protein
MSTTEERQRAASRYIEQGMSVIPVGAGEKKPERSDWQNMRLSPEDVTRYFNDGQNIGLLTGEPSGGRVDADLDADEAVKIADQFLPPTLTSGRESRPFSHRWFRSPGAVSRDWKDTSGEKLVELRSSGRQTIVAPSTHPDGDEYLWHSKGGLGMAEISAEELEQRCCELATATLIARHVPPVGGRHDFALALAGYLLRPGRLDREMTLKIMLAAWHAADADSREATRDLEGIVRDTAENLRQGEPVTGGPTLEESAPGVIKLLCKWWDWTPHVHVYSTTPKPLSWPHLAEEALYGLPGDFVLASEPHTEADPVALLFSFMAAYGNAIGRRAHARVGPDEHHLKLFVGLVGPTAKGRKGVSWGPVGAEMDAVDPGWFSNRVVSGLSSGEGLIHAVRDEVIGVKKGEEVVLDPGESDKRLMSVERELASILKIMSREGNTLSPVMRQAWDGDRLRTLTKNNPTKFTGAHISIIGHITKDELLRHLSETEAANGFANRFVWVLVSRSKELPFGGDVPETTALRARLDSAIRFGRVPCVIRWGESARGPWAEVYGPLSEGKPGMFGAVTGRAEAQTLRLATLYAVMDESETIEYEHLAAALALWDYAEESARYIFGDATGDPVADDILEALRAAGDAGLSRTEIRDLFARHKKADRINGALHLLLKLGRVRKVNVPTDGRPTEIWYAT